MKNKTYKLVRQFKKKYPKTVAFRIEKHSEVIDLHINDDENLLYAFCGQNNVSSLMIINSCVIALTDQRILIGQKKLFGRYYFTTVTPDLYNDLKVRKNLIWSDIEIDTVKENIYISNIDPKGAIEIESVISKFMIEEKQKYGKLNENKNEN